MRDFQFVKELLFFQEMQRPMGAAEMLPRSFASRMFQ